MKKETIKQKIDTTQQPQSKNVIDIFFRLGKWATRGDPLKEQDFMYYMLWILFLAFFSMFLLNVYRFFTTWDVGFLIWAMVGFAICSLQYFNLKNFYTMRKARKEMGNQKSTTMEEEHKIEDVDEMLGDFKKESEKEYESLLDSKKFD